MEEAKGLSKPVKLKNDLAEFLGATELPRTQITKKLWDYIKENGLQTKTENGKPENAGKFIVADAELLPIFRNTRTRSKSGKITDLTEMKEGQTIHMMQIPAVVGAKMIMDGEAPYGVISPDLLNPTKFCKGMAERGVPFFFEESISRQKLYRR